ncbi:MAG: putative transcriptional regulator, LumQ-like [Rhizobacter sp.]|nr:putative transcriptional regulator, LumQ-like [Rhizobacter sp.]
MHIRFDASPSMPANRYLVKPGVPMMARPSGRLMWLDTDRVLYVGLLGVPSVRNFGAVSVYVSLRVPHRISLNGGPWQTTDLSVVPPHVPHRILCDERMICNLLIEVDAVDLSALPDFIRDRAGAVDAPGVLADLRAAVRGFQTGTTPLELDTRRFDEAFFGEALPGREMDRRIRTVVDRIKQNPTQQMPAEDCAAAAHLSFSRFLHLFKSEVGTPFRSFRTWHRARSMLNYVTRNSNLAHIALDIGYPDSTHFSHSVRQVYGLTPKDIFAGCRRLALYGGGPGESA